MLFGKGVEKWSPADSLADNKMDVTEADDKNQSLDIPATPSPKRIRQSLTSDSPNFYDFAKGKTIVNKFNLHNLPCLPIKTKCHPQRSATISRGRNC